MRMAKWYRIFPNLLGIVILMGTLFTARSLSYSPAFEAMIAEKIMVSALTDNYQLTIDVQSTPGCNEEIANVQDLTSSALPAGSRMPSGLLILVGSGLIGLIGLGRKIEH